MSNNNNMTITPIISALEKSFDVLNNKLFDNKLKRPVITLAEGSKIRAYGWFVCKEIWHDNNNNSACELNISSDYLKRPFEEIVKTLAHEMIHCCNYAEGIQDCARAGQRHNKHFKECAEKHNMIWLKPAEDDTAKQEYYKKFGYSDVDLKDEIKESVYADLQFLKEALTIYRDEKNSRKKSKSNVIKYMCPVCGCSCRATKQIFIRCMECDEDMIVDF